MIDTSGWDWSPGKREVADTAAFAEGAQWVEEFQASPDGEKLAVVVRTEDEDFAVRINGEDWGEDRYEKAYNLRFAPDGRLMACVSVDMEWTMAVDGESWPEGYGFIMRPRFVADSVFCGIQQDMRYGCSLNGAAWETLYDNANQFAADAAGEHTAAVIQAEPLAQADIYKYQSGIFTVAVDGTPWAERFVNCYTPVFAPDASKVACQVRRSLYDYTIAVDGKVWGKNYQCVWEPAFNPATGAVVAPVRVGGKWGLAQDNDMIWDPLYFQLWQQQFSPCGKNIFAICAPSFGEFTVIKNKAPWGVTFPVVTDLRLSPDGQRACAIGRDGDARYHLMLDGAVWPGAYDMLFWPVFSPDSAHVAIRADKGGRQVILVDGKPYGEDFEQAFDPAFSPDSKSVLIKGLKNGKFTRIVAALSDF
ncbi:MAG: electron transfer complex subunit TmcD [Desulfovibrionaceae bacterium]